MAKLSIELTAESRRKIKQLERAGGSFDFRPTLKVIGIGYRKEVGAIFDKKQPRSPFQRWPALSEPYATRKAKEFPGAPLLVRSGSLLASMTVQGAPGNLTLIKKDQAIFGSTIDYGVFHDEGTSKMPKRNFSEPSDRRIGIWKTQIEDDMRRHFEQHGIRVSGAFLK